MSILEWVVQRCPWLYFRAGYEFTIRRCHDGSYTGPHGDPTDITTWRRFRVSYRAIAEHHGFVNPKSCRFPSFTKTFATASLYARENNLRHVDLVFCRHAIETWQVLKDDLLWHDMLMQNNYIRNLRTGTLRGAYEYALWYAAMDGKVFITNEFYASIMRITPTTATHEHGRQWP